MHKRGRARLLSLSQRRSENTVARTRASKREGDDARLDGRNNDRSVSRGEGKESAHSLTRGKRASEERRALVLANHTLSSLAMTR